MLSAVLCSTALFSTAVIADAAAEQTAKNLCAGCHGPNGISTNPLWPNLAGQKAEYAAKQLRAFRDGTRTDPVMNPLSVQLTDAQIDALAVYYSRMPGGG
jgi:cytochrome c553